MRHIVIQCPKHYHDAFAASFISQIGETMLRTLSAVGAIQVAIMVANLIRAKVIALLVGPEGVGVISIIDQVVQVSGQLVAFSLPFMAVKFLSRTYSETYDSFQQSYTGILNTLMFITGAGTVLLVLLTLVKPEWLGSELYTYRLLLLPGLLAIPAAKIHGFSWQVLAAAGRVRSSALMVLGIAVTLALSSIVGITVGGLEGFYWANTLASFGIVVVLLIYFQRALQLRFRVGLPRLRALIQQNPGIVQWSLIMYVTSFITPLSLLVARYSVLSYYGEFEAGLLQAAIGVGAILGALLTPMLGLYLTPLVNRALAVEEKIARTLEFQQQLLRIIGVLGMPIILFSDWVLTLQYSPRFADASMVLFLFIVAQVFTQLAGIYQALLMGLDASWAYALSVMIGQGVYITLTWVLTPTYGLSGVGVAALVSGCLLFVLTGLQLRRRFQMGFSRRLILSTLYCVGALLAAGWVNTYLDSSNFTVIAGRIAFYGVFVGSLWLITRQEPNPVYEDQPVLEKTPQG